MFAQFADLEGRLKVANSSLADLERASDPVLEMVFPGARAAANPPSRVELLGAAPERLRAHMKEVALISFDQALAVLKSHYPRADLTRFGEGYAEGVTEESVAALLEEARPISNVLVENLDLDPAVE